MDSNVSMRARSVASHMVRYAEPFVRTMHTLENTDLTMMSQEMFEDRIMQEVEYLKKELDQVITDMFPVDKNA